MSQSPDEDESVRVPHTVVITKDENQGFGFNVRGQVQEGGAMKCVNGELYAPLQFVSAVMRGGAAQIAGLKKYDRILEVNGVACEGKTHQFVVDLIRRGGDSLSLMVISTEVDDDDSSSYSRSGSIGEQTRYFPSAAVYRKDYSERRSLPITVPSE